MSETQVITWLAFVLGGIFVGFMSGYYIGYDVGLGIKKSDPAKQKWYTWPAVKVRLDDHVYDNRLAREISEYLKKNVSDGDYKIYVQDEDIIDNPLAVFYIKDRNVALTLSIKHNITYMKGSIR